MDMRLARIDRTKEYNWLYQTAGQSKAWVGVNDISKEGKYVNSDGCRLRFLRWARGEPSKKDGEDCGQLWSSRGLNDNQCNLRFPFLCKKSRRNKRTRCGSRVTCK